ncbi:hypothetical protein PCC6912_12640 [Chlorogloeopsis fritschii PCC 6912]|uniref:Uncharacterized protein n=1 Tax=Chlorogloeopsis fritschii PCC 6912 TaxID=211165 RepID=A0A3S1FTA7_CHLFR|nr:hypothetical protein PCC6912_12640 [Chlorogloeopsis fritschii PCC 6912]
MEQAVSEVSKTAKLIKTAERFECSTVNHKLSVNPYPSASKQLKAVAINFIPDRSNKFVTVLPEL